MSDLSLPPSPQSRQLLAEAERCVACASCVPHCPTYRKTLSEADSPRGRIAQMRAVLQEQIPPTERFLEHIDLCLTCRACEAICPSQVRYGTLVNGVRALLEGSRPGRPANRILRNTVARPRRLQALGLLLAAYQRSGLQRLARGSGLLRVLRLDAAEARLPPVRPWRPRAFYAAVGQPQGEVALFLGCIARIADTQALRAALHVLTRLGYAVRIPGAQNCCGALHEHSGDAHGAERLARQNAEAFAQAGPATVVGGATACIAQLRGAPATRETGLSFEEICAFLVEAKGWEQARIQPLDAEVLVHEPCSLKNQLRGGAAPYRLLARIPHLRAQPLPGNDQCCGGAGAYMLEQPVMAEALLADKVAAVGPDARYLLTTNPGCALHLAYGLGGGQGRVEVLHPVTLLARQMGFR